MLYVLAEFAYLRHSRGMRASLENAQVDKLAHFTVSRTKLYLYYAL